MRTLSTFLLVAFVAACSGEDAGRSAAASLPEESGLVRFVLPPVPAEPGDRNRDAAPEQTETLLFGWRDGALQIGLARGGFSVPPKTTGEEGRITLDYRRDASLHEDVGWRGRDIELVELVPLDRDGDGRAERIRGTFTGVCEHFELDYYDETRPFTATVEAAIEPLAVAAPKVTPDAASPVDVLEARFELPVDVVEARVVDGSAAILVSRGNGGRTTQRLTPLAPLPWGRSLVLETTVRIAEVGTEPVTHRTPFQVIPGPAESWTPSFEGEDPLSGLLLLAGDVTAADASSGVEPLDGASFLLAENRNFELLFDVDVPDVDAPMLVIDARFLFQTEPYRDEPTPWLSFAAVGEGQRLTASVGGFAFADGGAGSTWAGASAVRSLELDLAALRGTRAVVALRGRTDVDLDLDGTELPVAQGLLQLDGLRLVDAAER